MHQLPEPTASTTARGSLLPYAISLAALLATVLGAAVFELTQPVAAQSVVAQSVATQPVKSQPVTPSTPRKPSGRQVSLYDQLRVGLKAFTKEDLAFIKLVVLRVKQGELPRNMVDSTFLWARDRYKNRPGSHRLRPMVYFRPALVARARGVGVKL